MQRLTHVGWLVLSVLTIAHPAAAFCGFYVSKTNTALFNKSSQVVPARDGDRTVLTMANDFQGDPTEFAMVIPVPTLLQRDQIRVGDKRLVDHLDAYSAPRLVEYFDGDPCRVVLRESLDASAPLSATRTEQEESRNRPWVFRSRPATRLASTTSSYCRHVRAVG